MRFWGGKSGRAEERKRGNVRFAESLQGTDDPLEKSGFFFGRDGPFGEPCLDLRFIESERGELVVGYCQVDNGVVYR